MAKAPEAPVKAKIDPQGIVADFDRDRLTNVPGALPSDWKLIDGNLYIATVAADGTPKLVVINANG